MFMHVSVAESSASHLRTRSTIRSHPHCWGDTPIRLIFSFKAREALPRHLRGALTMEFSTEATIDTLLGVVVPTTFEIEKLRVVLTVATEVGVAMIIPSKQMALMTI
jgi:hypothetical protein